MTGLDDWRNATARAHADLTAARNLDTLEPVAIAALLEQHAAAAADARAELDRIIADWPARLDEITAIRTERAALAEALHEAQSQLADHRRQLSAQGAILGDSNQRTNVLVLPAEQQQRSRDLEARVDDLQRRARVTQSRSDRAESTFEIAVNRRRVLVERIARGGVQ